MRVWHIDHKVYNRLPVESQLAVHVLADRVGGPFSFVDCAELWAVGGSVYGRFYLNDADGKRYLEPGTNHAAYRVERLQL